MLIESLKDQDSETKILEAAKTVFTRKGMDGATMQEIADEAQISRTSLHYYFRNKEKLFEIIFAESLDRITPRFNKIIEMPIPLFEKIELFVENYLTVLTDNPMLPGLIVHEMSRDPHAVFNIINTKGIKLDKLLVQIELEKMGGVLRNFPIEHFVVNIFSLCVFPFLAKPLLEEYLFDNDENKFLQFIEERKKVISESIILFIKK